MKASTTLFPSLVFAYVCSISAVYAKSLEDIFSEMLALRTTDPAGFWAMVSCIGLLFALAFGLMALTMGYYVKHWTKRK
ncbi:MAG TPA: hypothetical protein EYN91_27090 [Candidatus Melainabacteria bacterium]|jgi:hypothetical protein|nr:hypothetical protein [Candidatus Melainabacteria bacterium]HIN63239.1 hypothetical protein [Candidatus Obscuribacterales bacterium]